MIHTATWSRPAIATWFANIFGEIKVGNLPVFQGAHPHIRIFDQISSPHAAEFAVHKGMEIVRTGH